MRRLSRRLSRFVPNPFKSRQLHYQESLEPFKYAVRHCTPIRNPSESTIKLHASHDGAVPDQLCQ
jgi:hypothetical protein